MARLDRLALTDFRNYRHLAWRPDSPVTVVAGENGSGKTNLLEALSLLVPGRGLRGARGSELARHGTALWGVAARFAAPGGALSDIATGSDPARPERRAFRRDGQALRNRAALADDLAAVWLTPQMDRLFQDGLPGRRRFLDRLVLALEPGHARQLAAHDQAMAQRNRLLAGGRADTAWLNALEDSMARHAVAASAARLALVAQMNHDALPAPDAFPAARIDILCPIADRLRGHPALAVEDWLRGRLAAERGADAARGGAGAGAHRADMALSDRATGRPAAQASTGQQKALLLGVVLAHAALIAGMRGEAPMILLDEPLVHLDERRRAALLDRVAGFATTVLMTGTDAAHFAPLRGKAGFVSVQDGAIRPSDAIRPPDAGSHDAKPV
ncbi:DNA replication/repair protein RecF [Nguyenibacter vanlangensis]|uniref:DNA replication and repair protein RecF n=3 Tax=Nguyenibacter vanlangensis TaxID=1216886 RepID=A0ABZ3D758_9PROT